MPWEDLDESLHEMFHLSQTYRYEDALERRASELKAYADRNGDFTRERRSQIHDATREERRKAHAAARERRRALALLHEKQRAKILKAWQDAHQRDVEKRNRWHAAKLWVAPIKQSQNKRRSMAQLCRFKSAA